MPRKKNNPARVGVPQFASAPEPLFPGLIRGDTPLYLAALTIILLGVWGIWFALEDTAIGILVLCGAIVGFILSLWARQKKEPLLVSLLFLAAGLGFILLLRKLFGIYLLFWIAPTILMMPEPTLAATAGMGLILVITCFFFITRPSLTFAIVPVLTIFGLLGSLLDFKVIIAFLIFLLISIFLLGYEHILTLKEEFGLQLSRADTLRLPSQQMRISGGFLLVVLIIGLLLGSIFTAVFSHTSVQGLLDALEGLERIAPDVRGSERPSVPNRGFAGSRREFLIGRGPTTLSEAEVMYVRADSPAFWRERVYDLYTGKDWRLAPGPASTQKRIKRGKAVLSDSSDPRSHHLLRQEFRPVRSLSRTIPAAAQPLEIQFGRKSTISSISVDRFGCLRPNERFISADSSYSVISAVANIAGPSAGETLSSSERERCLQFPWEARRVKDLVEEILPQYLNPAAKVDALLAHIQSGQYYYTLQAQAVPRDEDAATYFLFDSREGYCDLFATAFALMCRAAGVPSRLAVGFTEGEFNPSTGEYLVRQSDGHAWVEVFVEGRGWMTIDPTPPAEITEAAQQARAGPSWLKKILQKMHFSWGVLIFCLLVCAGIVKVLWFDPWSEQRRWEKRLWTDMRGRIIVLYARMCRLLARRGLLRQPWQTPLEYLEMLSADKGKMGAALGPAEELTEIFISSRYAGETAGPQNVTAAQRALLRLKRSLRRNGRLRFLWKKQG